MDRRKFVEKTVLLGCSISIFPALQSCKTTQSMTSEFVKNPINIEEVREVVYYAHSDLKQVENLISKSPKLINSTVDWGDGDFESALGAASHVGNLDIANYLIQNGARMDIFTMAMLGYSNDVINIIKRSPSTINIIGPHGLTLLHHAEIGVSSPDLSDYLKSNGLKEKFIETFKN